MALHVFSVLSSENIRGGAALRSPLWFHHTACPAILTPSLPPDYLEDVFLDPFFERVAVGAEGGAQSLESRGLLEMICFTLTYTLTPRVPHRWKN